MSTASEAIVFIMGADTPTGLTAARCLRSSRVRIYGTYQNKNAPTLRSCCWDGLVCLSGSISNQFRELVNFYQSGFKGEKSVLLFSSDDQVLGFWENPSILKAHFILPIMSEKDGRLLMSKTSFYRWALDRGLPVPETACIDQKNFHEILRVYNRFPAVLKPTVRDNRWNQKFPNKKLLVFESKDELLSLMPILNIFEFAEEYVLQQRIEGGDHEVYFVLYAHDLEGRRLGRVTGRKIFQWPPEYGSTAMCEVFYDEELVELADRFSENCHLVGLNSIEFKRDTVSGRFFMTEPTVGRNDYQSGISRVSSENLNKMLLDCIVGNVKKDGIRFTKLNDGSKGLWVDEFAMARIIKKGGLRPLGVLIKSLIRAKLRVSFIYFSFSDMAPFLINLRGLFKNRGNGS